jgi:nucleotide-binding universal stress UspA family protein
MKKILVPTDFSKHAEYALNVAAQLAQKKEAEIYLLHVIELPVHTASDIVHGTPISTGAMPEALFFIKLAEKKLNKLLEEPYLKAIKIHKILERQSVFASIADVAEKHHIDLIVMGSEGATGLKEMFVGSNTEKVVRHANTPVLVIKKPHNHFTIKKMVFATNLEETSVTAFKKVKQIANFFKADIFLLYVNTPNSFNTSAEIDEKMKTYIEKENISITSFEVYNHHKVEWGILNYAQKIEADVIAMATHGRKGLSHFFNGSISEDLANHAHRPVLTLKI